MIMRNALLLLLAAMALVAADGCDAKSALGPRSTAKREIEVRPAGTAKPVAPAIEAAAPPVEAITREANATPKPAPVRAPPYQPPPPVAGPDLPALEPVIELSSPTVTRMDENLLQATVDYRFIQGEPNQNRYYMVQADFFHNTRPET